MKSPHHVNQHRKPQLHVQSQEMQVMDLVLEAIFRPDIETARNTAAKQITKTTYRSPGATIQENTNTTTAKKRRASELVKRNGIQKTQWTIQYSYRLHTPPKSTGKALTESCRL